MGFFIACENCPKTAPPPHFRLEGRTLCLTCADVLWEEYVQALERLGGSRYGNHWAPGVEDAALKLSAERREEASELEWYSSATSEFQTLTEDDVREGVIMRADRGYGSARIFKDLTWEVYLCDNEIGVLRTREDGSVYQKSRFLAATKCKGQGKTLDEAKAESGRQLCNLRPLIGLLQYLKL